MIFSFVVGVAWSDSRIRQVTFGTILAEKGMVFALPSHFVLVMKKRAELFEGNPSFGSRLSGCGHGIVSDDGEFTVLFFNLPLTTKGG